MHLGCGARQLRDAALPQLRAAVSRADYAAAAQLVTESARAHRYFLSKQVHKSC